MKTLLKRIPLIVLAVFVGMIVLGVILNKTIGDKVNPPSSKSETETGESAGQESQTPEPTSEATPEPTIIETPEPTADPTPEPTPEATAEPTAEPTPEAAEISHPDKTLKSGTYTIPSGIELTYDNSVRNDSTGNWRKSLMADSRPINDFALEYYQTMMADDEIHAVVNFTLNTTTSFNAMSGLLFVDTYEYVKGEEHDANMLFSGQPLTSEVIDLSTGEPADFPE